MTASRIIHPEDLLEAFALDALEPEEEQNVLDHLEECLNCSSLVSGYLATTAALVNALPESTPPEHVRANLLAIIDPPQPPPLEATRTPVPAPSNWSRVYTGLGRRWGRMLMPATAVAAVAVAAFLIAVNVQVTGDRDEMMAMNTELQESLEESRATATAQLALASSAIAEMQGDLQFLQNTLAQPGNQSLIMNPMQVNSRSRGVLVVSGDMSVAVVMASGLEIPEDDSAYHVWLMQRGQRTWIGNMDVDEGGWGTMALNMGNSMSQFDALQLSRAPLSLASVGIVGDVILDVALP